MTIDDEVSEANIDVMIVMDDPNKHESEIKPPITNLMTNG